jgi:hypothetical protein
MSREQEVSQKISATPRPIQKAASAVFQLLDVRKRTRAAYAEIVRGVLDELLPRIEAGEFADLDENFLYVSREELASLSKPAMTAALQQERRPI